MPINMECRQGEWLTYYLGYNLMEVKDSGAIAMFQLVTF